MKESTLFTPFNIGPVRLRNRTIRAAAFEGMGYNNAPTDKLLNYHKSVAAGGIGMTTLAYASVTHSGISFPTQLLMCKDIVPALRRITDVIHNEGAAASIQIGHCGNMSHRKTAGCIPISASAGFNIYSPTLVRGMRRDEIFEMVKQFGHSVNLAREAGFDCVEVHAGHGYLISQFLSPYTNKRKDDFGGTLENRMRFMNLVADEVMRCAGNDMGIIFKVNIRDGFKGGMEINECIEVAKSLQNKGVHALVLSGGFVSKAPMYVMRGSMPFKTLTHYMKDTMLALGIKLAGRIMIPSEPFKEAYFYDDAIRFREQLNIPLIYVGGLISRDKIDMVLDSGFEFVAMARALVNDPAFVKKMQNGEATRCNCGHSNYCIGRMYSEDMVCHKNVSDLPKHIVREINKSENR